MYVCKLNDENLVNSFEVINVEVLKGAVSVRKCRYQNLVTREVMNVEVFSPLSADMLSYALIIFIHSNSLFGFRSYCRFNNPEEEFNRSFPDFDFQSITNGFTFFFSEFSFGIRFTFSFIFHSINFILLNINLFSISPSYYL